MYRRICGFSLLKNVRKTNKKKVHCCACLHIIVHKEVHIECAQHKLQFVDGILPPQPFFVCLFKFMLCFHSELSLSFILYYKHTQQEMLWYATLHCIRLLNLFLLFLYYPITTTCFDIL